MGHVVYFGLCLLGCLIFTPVLDAAGQAEPAPPRAKCPPGVLYFGNNCYELFQIAESWESAEGECQFHREGAQLASILSGAEERALTAHIRRVSTAGDVWIGLSATRTAKKLVWRWSDGSSYVSGTALWDNRAPSTALSTLECISLTNVQNSNTSRWIQRTCATALPFVCKYKAGF